MHIHTCAKRTSKNQNKKNKFIWLITREANEWKFCNSQTLKMALTLTRYFLCVDFKGVCVCPMPWQQNFNDYGNYSWFCIHSVQFLLNLQRISVSRIHCVCTFYYKVVLIILIEALIYRQFPFLLSLCMESASLFTRVYWLRCNCLLFPSSSPLNFN